MTEHAFITPKEQKGYAEEMVILDERQELLKYSLSNNLDDIKIAIYARTGHDVDLDKAHWKLNPHLSITTKHLMNRYHVAYSMVTDRNYILVNMRVGDKWFITGYEEFDGKYINFGLLEAIRCFMKILDNMDDDE